MLSEENTARAVGLPRRSCSRRAVARGGPRRSRVAPYPVLTEARGARRVEGVGVTTMGPSIPSGSLRWREEGGPRRQDAVNVRTRGEGPREGDRQRLRVLGPRG